MFRAAVATLAESSSSSLLSCDFVFQRKGTCSWSALWHAISDRSCHLHARPSTTFDSPFSRSFFVHSIWTCCFSTCCKSCDVDDPATSFSPSSMPHHRISCLPPICASKNPDSKSQASAPPLRARAACSNTDVRSLGKELRRIARSSGGSCISVSLPEEANSTSALMREVRHSRIQSRSRASSALQCRNRSDHSGK